MPMSTETTTSFSASGEDALTRPLDIRDAELAAAAARSDEDCAVFYEIERTARELVAGRYRRVRRQCIVSGNCCRYICADGAKCSVIWCRLRCNSRTNCYATRYPSSARSRSGSRSCVLKRVVQHRLYRRMSAFPRILWEKRHQQEQTRRRNCMFSQTRLMEGAPTPY